MSDAPRPPSSASAPPPVPPYAAAPPYATTPPGPPVPPYAQGYAQQPYPGAAPVWATATPAASKALAGTALALAIFGAVITLVPFGVVASWLFLGGAIVLAIIALVRRAAGRGMSIAALVVSGAGILIAALWGVALALFGSVASGFGELSDPLPYESDEYSYEGGEGGVPFLGVDDGTGGASRTDALPYGTSVTIVDESTGEPVWEILVGAPEDITTAASDSAPLNGAYLAVPIEVTNLTDERILPNEQYEFAPYAWLLTGDGGRADVTYVPAGTRQFPQIWDLDVIEEGDAATYYETFDVAASVTATGYLVLELDSGEQVFWGP